MITTKEDQAKVVRLIQLLENKQWRMRHLYMILPDKRIDPETGEEEEATEPAPWVLRPEQEELLQETHSRVIVSKARKVGYSTELLIDSLDECLWNKNRHCVHVDFKEKDAYKKLGIARLAWFAGPKHPNPAIADIWRGIHCRLRLIKNNESTLEWSNGSRQEAGQSFMGGTPHRIHLSEYGPMSAERPKAAALVKVGTFNALAPGGKLTIETTMRGGPFGECYAVFKLGLDGMAKRKQGKPLNRKNWLMLFCPWYVHPDYDLPGQAPQTERIKGYFAELEKDPDFPKLPDSRKAWYEETEKEQGENMFTEFPSTKEESVQGKIAGAIYPQMIALKAKGRIGFDLEPTPGVPMFSSWDIGISDFMSGWLIQPNGPQKWFVDWSENEGVSAAHVAAVLIKWKNQFPGVPMKHFVPHDADHRSVGDGQTFAFHLRKALAIEGMQNDVILVPRTKDIWIGINAVRDQILPNAYFHKRCSRKRKSPTGADLPSGVDCLRGYKKEPPSGTGQLKEQPLHDLCSHTADALRTFGEAWVRGMVASAFASTQVVAKDTEKRDGKRREGRLGSL